MLKGPKIVQRVSGVLLVIKKSSEECQSLKIICNKKSMNK